MNLRPLLLAIVLLPGCEATPAADAATCERFADAVDFIRGLAPAQRTELAARLAPLEGEHKRLLLRALNYVAASEDDSHMRAGALMSCLPERGA